MFDRLFFNFQGWPRVRLSVSSTKKVSKVSGLRVTLQQEKETGLADGVKIVRQISEYNALHSVFGSVLPSVSLCDMKFYENFVNTISDKNTINGISPNSDDRCIWLHVLIRFWSSKGSRSQQAEA